MKVCRLYLSKSVSVFLLLVILAWPLLGVIGIVAALVGSSDGYGAAWAFVFVLAIGLTIAYGWLRIPFEIRVDDTTATFRSVLGKTVVPLVQIRSLRAKPLALGFVDLRHETGTLHLVSQMTGFHDFVLSVKSSNPMVRIEGC